MTDCEFCDVVAGDAPASVVHETDRVVAFVDVHPVTPGHTLVVPRDHARGLGDLDPEDGAAMMRVAMQVAGAFPAVDAVGAEGVNLFLADGAVAGQEVFHAHLHVVPRHEGDGVSVQWDRDVPSREELDEVAAAIGERV